MLLDDKISFLGDFWVIGDMNPVGGNEASKPKDGFIGKLYFRGENAIKKSWHWKHVSRN